MLELMSAIPENIGWVIVGFIACILCGQAIFLGRCLYQMWKERREDDEEEEEGEKN